MLIVSKIKFSPEKYGLGPRTLKTAFAVFICLLSAKFIGYGQMPVYACVAVCITMQDTPDHSIQLGKNRMLATFIAGILGVSSIWILEKFGYAHLSAYFSPLILIIAFVLCNVTNRKELCAVAGVVTLAIMMGDTSKTPVLQAIRRLFENAAGVAIAVLVNKYIMPNSAPKSTEEVSDTTVEKSPKTNLNNKVGKPDIHKKKKKKKRKKKK